LVANLAAAAGGSWFAAAAERRLFGSRRRLNVWQPLYCTPNDQFTWKRGREQEEHKQEYLWVAQTVLLLPLKMQSIRERGAHLGLLMNYRWQLKEGMKEKRCPLLR